MVGFVDLLFQAACDFGSSERIPRFLIKDISIYLLHTVGQTLNAAEANRIAKDLYDVDFHYSGKKKKKNVIKFVETSVSSSTIHDISTQYLLASKIGGLLAEMVFSQQIKSPDSLYPHAIKAVHALKVAFSGTQCVVGGELINVDDDAEDKIVGGPCGILEHDGNDWSASASACLYDHRGTTNYMNAILQCLHCVSELKSALFEWQPLFEKSSDHLLTAATRSHFIQLDKNAMAVAPRVFLQLFREMYSTSKLVDNHNPEDAEACWGQLLGTLSRSLKSTSFPSENFSTVNDLFDIKLVSREHCQESGEKPPEEKSVCMLECYVSSTVNHLHGGLRNFLESGLDEASPLSIGGLPKYLTIRFFRTNERANCKINSLEVDVYDLCSDDLRVKLEAARKKAKKPSGLKDLDVKMSDVEEGSSDASGDTCTTTCEEGVVCEQERQLTGVYHLVAFLARSKDPRWYGGNYSAFKARKKSDEQELTWYHCTNESHYVVGQKFVEKVMSGGAGCEPCICLYKAEVVN